MGKMNKGLLIKRSNILGVLKQLNYQIIARLKHIIKLTPPIERVLYTIAL